MNVRQIFALPVLGLLVAAVGACGGGESETEGETVRTTSVRVVQVAARPVQSWVYGQGTARAAQREFLTFQRAGRVVYVAPGLEIGSPVRRGQTIAYLQPERTEAELTGARTDLANARAQVSVAEAALQEAAANLELARETFARYARLIELNSASPQEYDEAEAQLASTRAAYARAEAQLAANRAQVQAAQAQVAVAQVTVSETRIVAPIDGVIARLNIERGRYFTPELVQAQSEQAALDTVPVVIVNPASFEISLDLPSFTSREVAVGAQALIRPSGAPVQQTRREDSAAESSGNAPPVPIDEFQIMGRVYAVSPALDPETRTYEARVRTTSGASLLQDGEFVSVWIRGDQVQDVPAIPFEAIRYRDDAAHVFVIHPETRRAEERPVELGLAGNEVRAILSGVRVGEHVVTDGSSALSDGDRVRVIGTETLTAADRPGA